MCWSPGCAPLAVVTRSGPLLPPIRGKSAGRAWWRHDNGLAALAADPRWSNEGLFAFLEGLRRLVQLDTGGRVAAPTIDLEV